MLVHHRNEERLICGVRQAIALPQVSRRVEICDGVGRHPQPPAGCHVEQHSGGHPTDRA